ncbi:MAG TPA: secretin N-terminal domain-containing protein [Candidatus Baltobacteraceae bacterium]|jgi:type II secretory pathway component GspD/PulD (secretin)|nr:secretin N-terminal domain-containing protein [Candidatus Baltobacteraceae bacterium]
MKTKHLVWILLATMAAGCVALAADTRATVAPNTDMPAGVTPTNGFILNFHEVPLDAVLNYLSGKVGLIITSDVDLKGKVSVVAKQPVTTNEIVDLLNAQLARNNYAAVLSGRTLTIMDAARAKTSALTPVIVNSSGPNQIPFNDKIVTEILPIHTLQPAQLVKDLAALIPPGDTVTPNDAGNAIIMTASQKDVHRISEIIAALDSSAVSDVEVFVLRYADAKSVAAELKEIFQSADSEVTRASTRSSFGGPDGMGPPGFPGGGGGNSGDTTKNAQTHAVFVSDDQMNAVVASAPPDYMPSITNVIEQLDRASQDITEIKVFKLKHADPSEIVDELSSLFPSSNNDSDQNNRSMGFQFNPFQQQATGNSSQSTRMKRKTTVLAVADRRTESVVVTASRDSMVEINGMIAALDEGNQGMTYVTAIPLESADPAAVQQTMAGLFAGQGASSSSTTTTALSARTQGNNNSQSSSTTSSTSGFGTGSSGSSASH